ncbi:MAG: twin-arginine translocase subunit TatC [Bacillota bacterium]
MTEQKAMSVVEHLSELRRRLIISAFAVFLGSAGCFTFVATIRTLFTLPAGNVQLVYLTPPEVLMTDIKVAFTAGILVASPVVLYQVWAFVVPGLKPGEKRLILPVVIASLVFFLLGVLFSYFIVLPFTLRFFLGFEMPGLAAMFSYSRYVSFAMVIIFSFGLIFQMPLVILLLGRLGIVTSKGLRRTRKFAILVVFIVAAVLTPPDIISQVLMAGPMIVLYELSIALLRLSRR